MFFKLPNDAFDGSRVFVFPIIDDSNKTIEAYVILFYEAKIFWVTCSVFISAGVVWPR